MSTISDGWLVGNADRDTSARLSTELGISSLTARILVSRGFTDPASAHNFLNNTTLKMYDPFLLADMDKAVVFIKDAVRSGRRICVYGDYDVDGVHGDDSAFNVSALQGRKLYLLYSRTYFGGLWTQFGGNKDDFAPV